MVRVRAVHRYEVGEASMAKPTTRYNLSGDRGDNILNASTLSAVIQAGGVDISGNAGNDTLIGGSGKDVMKGGDGNDLLVASLTDLQGTGAGSIVYDGGNGSDTLDLSGIPYDAGTGIWLRMDLGGKGSNFIRTNVQFDETNLFGDPITYSGSSFSNNFKGIENFILGDGDDLVQMLTPNGPNRIFGGGGNDQILSGDGDDYVDGGSGNDILNTAWGNDTIIGGTGNDVFAITGRLVGEYTHDVIVDFETKLDGSDTSYDQIWLWEGWSLVWDTGSPDILHGYLYDAGTLFGEVTLNGLTLADAQYVGVYNVDPSTGFPDYFLV